MSRLFVQKQARLARLRRAIDFEAEPFEATLVRRVHQFAQADKWSGRDRRLWNGWNSQGDGQRE
jgi:hypothetical protein